mmetsp:Transcript_7292/g.12091  ORF Transcript_7292/g.12091 Transcript_7292/m.12091 type:complete len:88 (+) Transcript_7292:146-409(+)
MVPCSLSLNSKYICYVYSGNEERKAGTKTATIVELSLFIVQVSFCSHKIKSSLKIIRQISSFHQHQHHANLCQQTRRRNVPCISGKY